MPNYLSPGVYVEEVEAGSRPIEGVGTAVAAFVGLAGRGPANTPTLVTNWNQFTSTFGDFIEGSYLAHAVYGYFLNGGGAAYVVRVGADGVDADRHAPSCRARPTRPSPPSASRPSRPARRATTSPSTSSRAGDGAEGTFKLVVKQGGKVVETFDNVTAGKGKTERRDRGQGAVQDDRDRGGRQRPRGPGDRLGQRSPAAAPPSPRA